MRERRVSQERSNQGGSSGVVSVRTFFAAVEMLATRSEYAGVAQRSTAWEMKAQALSGSRRPSHFTFGAGFLFFLLLFTQRAAMIFTVMGKWVLAGANESTLQSITRVLSAHEVRKKSDVYHLFRNVQSFVS